MDLNTELLDHLSSRVVVEAKKGVGSFLDIYIGEEAATTIDGAILHIWVYLCDWKLTQNGHRLLVNDSPDQQFTNVLSELIGTQFEAIRIGCSKNELVVRFSNDLCLTLSENLDVYQSDDDLIILFSLDKEPIGYQSKIGFYRGN